MVALCIVAKTESIWRHPEPHVEITTDALVAAEETAIQWQQIEGLHPIRHTIILTVQIESRQAVEQVDEIMAVEGVNGCWIDPNDLGRSMGLDLTKAADVKTHQAAITRTLEACKAAGKIPGIAFGPTIELIEQGFLFLTPGSAEGLISEGSRVLLQTLRS